MGQVTALRKRITDEIFAAMGLGRTSLARRILGPVFYLPTRHFARIAASFDDEVTRSGLNGGARLVLPDFSMTVTTNCVGQIPPEGPLLVASNHPGAYDSLAFAASIPRRNLSIMVSDVPFAHALSAASQHFIFVPPEPGGRMAALRSAIQHLRRGGALLIFPSGEVTPDPASMPGAREALQGWSSSLEIMLRKVPQTRLVVAIASNVLLPAFVNSPLVRIRRQPYHRQKLAEFIQVIQQMLFPRSVTINVHLSFAAPVCGEDLLGGPVMPAIQQIAGRLLEEHQLFFKTA
jgi:hypothetical protein